MPATFIYRRQNNTPIAAVATADSEVLPRNNSSFELDGVEYLEVEGSNRGGEGALGKVREFAVARNSDGGHSTGSTSLPTVLFVKSARNPESAMKMQDVQYEFRYYNRVYPQLNVQLDSGQDGDYRLILPDLGQEFADYAIANFNDALEFRELALTAFRELARIHQLGMVHRDIHGGNIMVLPGNRIHFIDGSLSREKSSIVNSTTPPDKQDISDLIEVICDTSETLFGMNVFPQLKYHESTRTQVQNNVEDILQLLARDYLSYHPLAFSDNTNNTMSDFTPFGNSAFTGGSLALKDIGKKGYLYLTQELAKLDEQYMEMQKNSLAAHSLILEIKNAIMEAIDHKELTIAFARQLCADTLLLAQGQQTTRGIEQYLKLAAAIENAAPCQTYTRRLSKAMVILGTAMLIAGLTVSCFGAPAAIAGGIAIFVFLVMAWNTKKDALQATIEDAVASQHPSTGTAAGMRVKHAFS